MADPVEGQTSRVLAKRVPFFLRPFLLLFHLFLLVFLHLVFAANRLISATITFLFAVNSLIRLNARKIQARWRDRSGNLKGNGAGSDEGEEEEEGRVLSDANKLERDLKIWDAATGKKPRHLAIDFVLGADGAWDYFTLKKRWGATSDGQQEQSAGLRKMLESTERLVCWSRKVGVETLTLYDETGLLKRHASDLTTHLQSALRSSNPAISDPIPTSSTPSAATTLTISGLSKPKQAQSSFTKPTTLTSSQPLSQNLLRRKYHQQTVSSSSDADFTLVASSSSSSPLTSTNSSATVTPVPSVFSSTAVSSSSAVSDVSSSGGAMAECEGSLTINLLDSSAGREHMAQAVARSLAESAKRREIMAEDIDIKILDEKIESSSGLSEPDLLIVLGGPYLRLHGFPPWQIRLSEIFHSPSPTWLPTPRIEYDTFRAAFNTYCGCKMNVGR